jgi:hypothetical protein
LKPNFSGNFKLSDPSITAKEIKTGIYELNLKKGQEVTLYQNDSDLKPITPVTIPQEKINFWGVK